LIENLLTKNSKLREGAVADGVGGLVGVHEAKRTVGGLVNVLVVENVMTVAEI
jgi:hypothetical protein